MLNGAWMIDERFLFYVKKTLPDLYIKVDCFISFFIVLYLI